MYSKTPKGRNPKGSVVVKNVSGRLQIVWRYLGKKYYLSPGLPESPVNRSSAEALAHQIGLDIATGNFDESLDKYRPQRKNPKPARSPKAKDIKLMNIWDRFVEFKRPQLAESTMHLQYGLYSKYLEKCPHENLDDAAKMRDWLISEVPIATARRVLVRLSAMGEWAVSSGLIAANPFKGLQSIKVPKAKRAIEVFTIEEKDLILEALAENQFCSKHSAVRHSFYRNFVEFLFLTGARPSEVTALQWKNLSRDFSVVAFEQRVMETDVGSKVVEGTKTEASRIFPCNGQLQALLKNQWNLTSRPDDLIFPGVGGGLLDVQNFSHKVWRPTLEKLGLKPHRLYDARHSFITWSLAAGMSVQDVAKLVGNSPEVIFQNYAGASRSIEVPEF